MKIKRTKKPGRVFTKREQQVAENYPDMLFADGFSQAILGIVERINTVAVCYDYQACVRILMKRGATWEDAVDHMDTNVCGSYVGEQTPFFLNRCRE